MEIGGGQKAPGIKAPSPLTDFERISQRLQRILKDFEGFEKGAFQVLRAERYRDRSQQKEQEATLLGARKPKPGCRQAVAPSLGGI